MPSLPVLSGPMMSGIDWKLAGNLAAHGKFAAIMRIAGSKLEAFRVEDRPAMERLNETCFGFSKPVHWNFFRWVMLTHPCERILNLGVYQGRDIAYMAHAKLSALARETPNAATTDKDWTIIGVDIFDGDEAAAAAEPQSPGQQFEGVARPRLSLAQENLHKAGVEEGRVKLLRDTDVNYLRTSSREYDFIYVDTSHYYKDTLELLELARARLAPGGMIAGDDYFDLGPWGVEAAVKKTFRQHEVFGGYIWYAAKEDYL